MCIRDRPAGDRQIDGQSDIAEIEHPDDAAYGGVVGVEEIVDQGDDILSEIDMREIG